MIKRTFLERGIEYASELAVKNTHDLIKILEWNISQGISMYRMSSDMFPWCSEYEIKDLPDFIEIQENLKKAGDLSMSNNLRLSFHPSPYCVIASQNSDVVEKSIKELRQHGEMMDLMGLPRNHFYPINIHVNTSKPSKPESAERFCQQFRNLPDTVKSRLVIENDDKKSLFTPSELYDYLYLNINIPITFDYLHYKCNPDEGISEETALRKCLSTWPSNIRPLTHYSDSRKLYEDANSKELSHSDWIYNKIETYGLEFSIELEVKMKDLALLRYIKDHMTSV
jgi:UV DNA damage endonuclease